jgi:hypothetical protein
MQTPTGYAINAQGQFVPVAGSWATMIFNPSFPYRLVHTVIAAYLTTAGGRRVGAWHLLRDRERSACAGDVLDGDVDGGAGRADPDPRRRRARAQHARAPAAKVMAMEGISRASPHGAPLILFGIPNMRGKRDRLCGRDPQGSSLILKHDLNAPLAGLDTVPADEQPPVRSCSGRSGSWSASASRSSRSGCGASSRGCAGQALRLALAAPGAWRWGRPGFVAVIAGWVTTEVGRQPWTSMACCAPRERLAARAPGGGASLIAFVLVYFAVFGIGTWYILKLMGKGAEPASPNSATRRSAPPGSRPALATGRREVTMPSTYDLATIWAFMIAFAVFAYVVMDGFDLGIGILFPAFGGGEERDGDERDRAGVGRQRDLAGAGRRRADGGLPAGLCDHDAGALSADHRDAARAGVPRRRVRVPLARSAAPAFWDFAFTAGSIVAALAQGITLGALLQGVKVVRARLWRRLAGTG